MVLDEIDAELWRLACRGEARGLRILLGRKEWVELMADPRVTSRIRLLSDGTCQLDDITVLRLHLASHLEVIHA